MTSNSLVKLPNYLLKCFNNEFNDIFIDDYDLFDCVLVFETNKNKNLKKASSLIKRILHYGFGLNYEVNLKNSFIDNDKVYYLIHFSYPKFNFDISFVKSLIKGNFNDYVLKIKKQREKEKRNLINQFILGNTLSSFIPMNTRPNTEILDFLFVKKYKHFIFFEVRFANNVNNANVEEAYLLGLLYRNFISKKNKITNRLKDNKLLKDPSCFIGDFNAFKSKEFFDNNDLFLFLGQDKFNNESCFYYEKSKFLTKIIDSHILDFVTKDINE